MKDARLGSNECECNSICDRSIYITDLQYTEINHALKRVC